MDVGTVGSTNGTFSRPSSPWSRSGTALVTTTAYNDSGWTDTVTDPRGIASKNYYDLLGRQTRTVAAFVDPGTNTLQTATDHNQITDYTFDGLDHVITQTAWVNNNGTNNVFQTTKYVYGVTTSTSGINDNDLLLQIQYPDKTTGNPNTNSAYTETYAYDALGEQTKKTQRTGSVHQYSHDVLGRMTSDNVITLGGGVWGSIRRQDYSFDTGGRLYQATSYSNSNGTTVVNQVQRDYNGLGQITREWQAHSGTVNVNAGTSQTMSVQYTYSEMSGGANHSRLTGIIYPYGNRTVTYAYNGNSGLDDIISRLSALTQTIGTNTTTLESYDYLGVGTIVAKHHPQNGIDLTYEQQAGDGSAITDGGDIYTGLDRFGRILDQNWLNTGTAGGSTDRFQYAYDANSNVQYKNNLVSSTFSELYHGNATATAHSYDNLNRLTDFRRGTLSASGGAGTTLDTVTTLNSLSGSSKNWNLDAQGNWSSVTTGGSTQNRTANQENQYTAVGGASLTYDNDGNLTTNQNGATYGYDAWDRLAHFTYRGGGGSAGWDETDNNIDALGRRVQVVTTGFNYCVATPSDDLYYSTDWQVLEDDNSIALNGGTGTGFNRMQFVWSPTYVNDLVLRDRDPSGNGNFSERFYVQQDANHNVTAITNSSNPATVQERFVYDPYGSATVLTSGWSTTTDNKNWLYLFQGGRWDSYVGLYDFQRREYDPTIGRWMQQDPAGYVDSLSLYQFVGSDPQALTDPTGLAGEGGTTQPGGWQLLGTTASTTTRDYSAVGYSVPWNRTLKYHASYTDLDQPNAFKQIAYVTLHWDLDLKGSMGYGEKYLKKPGGPAVEYKFKQYISREVTAGNVHYSTNGFQLDNSTADPATGTIPKVGGRDQKEWRDGVSGGMNEIAGYGIPHYQMSDDPSMGTAWVDDNGQIKNFNQGHPPKFSESLLFKIEGYKVCEGQQPELVDTITFGFKVEGIWRERKYDKDRGWGPAHWELSLFWNSGSSLQNAGK